MEKIEPKDIINSAAILANGIINNHNCGISIHADKEKIEGIWDFCLQIVTESAEKINFKNDDVIYDGDMVVLSIDGCEPERFILITLDGRLGETILPADAMKASPTYNNNPYQFINTHSSLGNSLLGGKVGDNFQIRYDGAPHQIQVLSFQRTTKSNKISSAESAANLTLYKKQYETGGQKRN